MRKSTDNQQSLSNGEEQHYMEAVKAIKQAILQSRYKAAVLANSEMLSLYFGVGKYVAQNSRMVFGEQTPLKQSPINYKTNCPD